jgi:hypothetical protein
MPLPRPTDHAERLGAALARRLAKLAPRRLFVDSVASGLVTLEEADGTLIDEPIAWISAVPLVPGDAVLVVPVPGTGDKHAAGSRVAIGPIRRTDLPSAIPDTPVVGVAAQNASDTASTTNTSTYVDALVVNQVLPAGVWTVQVYASAFMRHSAAGAVDVRTEIGGVGQTAVTQSVVSAGFDRVVTAGGRAAVAGGGSVAIKVQYKGNAAGTSTCDQPGMIFVATRTAA